MLLFRSNVRNKNCMLFKLFNRKPERTISNAALFKIWNNGYTTNKIETSLLMLPIKCNDLLNSRRTLCQAHVVMQKAEAVTEAKQDVKNDMQDLMSRRNELSRLLGLAKPEATYIAGAVALLIVSSSVTLAVPYCMGKVIDLIQTIPSDSSVQETMFPIALGLSSIFVVGALCNAGRIYLLQSSGQRITKQLRQRVFSRILSQDIAFFDKSQTGELINRLSSDVQIVSGSVTQNVSDGLRSIAQISAGVGMMYFMSAKLANVILMVVPPVALAAAIYGRYLRKVTQQTQNALAQSTQVAEERISNIRTVRSFAKENLECGEYSRKLQNVLGYALKEVNAKALFFGLTGLSGNAIMLLVLYNGSMMMHSGQLSVGDLSAFLLYSGYVAISIRGLSNFFTTLNQSLGASTRLWELTDNVPAIPLQGGIIPTDKLLTGAVTFSNVHFAYPERKDSAIFSRLNLNLESGQTTAVVGPSGCGKSTLAALLLRFYDPDSGVISVNGFDIKTLDPDWLRNNVGVVSQDPVLFSGTIAENIRYGAKVDSDPSSAEIERVADMANALSFVEDLPQKFETMVGERGIALSGGQRQRIAVARALLKDPAILILDEATSALDAESESLVREALERAAVGRTTLTIAHRLSTIRKADVIVVLDENGNVRETGSYDTLMTKEDGAFKQLIEKQMLLFR